MLPTVPILAQDAEYSDFFKPIVGLLVAVIALIVVVQMVRKWIGRNADLDSAPAAGFSLASLRDLVKQGKMTPEEYEKAKSQIVQATQRAAERAKPVTTIAPELKSPREMGE